MAQSKRHVIIDTDAGLDDAWAIFMMLAAHKSPKSDVNVVGITCVFGNTSLQNVTRNVTRVIDTAKEPTIPIFSGADGALVKGYFKAEIKGNPFHGHDGFGDTDLPPIEPKLQEEDAVSAIIRMASEYEKGTLSVLALGPLTNFAIAIRMRPDIKDKFKEIMILGGNIRSEGNASPCAEFNFVKDPEAARVVLENFTCPMTIVPLETFRLVYIPRFRQLRETKLAALGTPQIELLNKIEALQMSWVPQWAAADAVAAAAFIAPEYVKKTERRFCTVELGGEFTRGMMVVERRWQIQQEPNATIITDIDLELYEKLVVAGAGGPFYK